MPRYKQAPWGFRCPYKNSCPHMEGLSTMAVMHRYHKATIENADERRWRENILQENRDLLRTVRELEQQNDQLQAENKRLHEQKFKANRKKSTSTTEKTG